MKTVVETVVNTADIIRQDKDIYIYLFYKYKKSIEENRFGFVTAIAECQKEEEYSKMSKESQEKLFYDLMKIK